MPTTAVISHKGLDLPTGRYSAPVAKSIEFTDDDQKLGATRDIGALSVLMSDALQRAVLATFNPLTAGIAAANRIHETSLKLDEGPDSLRWVMPMLAHTHHFKAAFRKGWDLQGRAQLKPLLVTLELLNALDVEPDIYRLRSGETVMEFEIGPTRVSCVLNESYCHLMAIRNGQIADDFVEGDAYSIATVRERFDNLMRSVSAGA